ncbi:DDE-type integrase/transposase/recombinase [Streptomyces sp. NPDC005931]|uniref:DDE-type integrase/transposase/recombinase n=1 Tax=Streptomyces sp. NPDC005931 TaxID=3364737 RepID=UPI0036BCD7B6
MSGQLTCSSVTSPRPGRTRGGSPTSPTWPPGRGSSTSRFVVDVFSRAIVGWSTAASKRANLVLDALDMALWRRDRAGTPAGPGLVHHSDAGSQYTSFAFTAHLLEAGIDASVGTVRRPVRSRLVMSPRSSCAAAPIT